MPTQDRRGGVIVALFEWIERLFEGQAPEQPAPGDVSFGVSPFPSGAGPARLVVLRHAEKSGDPRDPHLSLAGRRRAEDLVTWIPATFGQPQFLIAARTSNKSRRPVETLEPLAAAFALEVRAKHADGESASLVGQLGGKKRYVGAIGVVSWRHSDLPTLLRDLGAPAGLVGPRWDAEDYTTIVDLIYPGDRTTHARRLTMPSSNPA